MKIIINQLLLKASSITGLGISVVLYPSISPLSRIKNAITAVFQPGAGKTFNPFLHQMIDL